MIKDIAILILQRGSFMSDKVQENQNTENTQKDKEYNFRNLEAKAHREISQREARIADLERQLQEKDNVPEPEDDDPYVKPESLEKRFAKFEQKQNQKTQEEVNRAVEIALENERVNTWLKNNSDFDEVMQEKNIERFYKFDQELAETILRMPDSFERKKLVYKNIKALQLHKEAQKQPAIQQTIDANRQNQYYQPSGIGNSPHTLGGDFSANGRKQAHAKMQELKSRLKLG